MRVVGHLSSDSKTIVCECAFDRNQEMVAKLEVASYPSTAHARSWTLAVKLQCHFALLKPRNSNYVVSMLLVPYI